MMEMYRMVTENKNLEALNAVVIAKGNKSEAAKTLGIPRTTLISRLEAAEREGIKPSVNPPDTQAALIEQKILYDLQISELKKHIQELAKENITAENVRKIVFKLDKYTPKPPKWLVKSSPAKGAPGVPTLLLSDFHWGEVVDSEAVNGLNVYDHKIAQKRLKSTVETTIDLWTNHMVNPKYPGIVVALGGDMISGHIHEELTETNAGTNIECVLDLLDHLIWAID